MSAKSMETEGTEELKMMVGSADEACEDPKIWTEVTKQLLGVSERSSNISHSRR